MTKSFSRFVKFLALASLGILAGLAANHLLWGQPRPGAAQKGAEAAPIPAAVPYIDTHTHFDEKDANGTVQAVLKATRVENAAKIYLQIPPFDFKDSDKYDAEVLLPAAKKYPDKMGVLGGGGSLNPMIMEALSTGKAGPDVQKKFRDRAEELVREGVAGFGEMAGEHFVGATGYEYAPPDHPLYLLLADVAAQAGVPIDIHMESVPQAMALPPELKSPPNAAQLHENITHFERLLSHNPRAKIIWAHLGTDMTGFRTPEISRRLLAAHSNLYLEIKYDPKLPGKNPVWVDGVVKAEWLKLFQEYPDRFVFGSDQHYPLEGQPIRWQSEVQILNQLPPDLRKKMAAENAQHIFQAKAGGGAAGAETKSTY